MPTTPLTPPPAPPPLLSANLALSIALLYTALYIAPFYLSTTLKSTPLTSRDHPAVIRARIRAVGLTSLLSTTITIAILRLHAHASASEILRLLGLYPIHPLDTLRVLALVLLLFTGPLFETLIIDRAYHSLSLRALTTHLTHPTTLRNLLIAPLSEELIFRALPLPLYLLTPTSPAKIILTTPLIFGLAHLHHLKDLLAAHTPAQARFPPLPVLAACLAQIALMFVYTALFGAFAAFVFLRTGSFWAVVGAHAFCNVMGLPRFWGAVGVDRDVEEEGGEGFGDVDGGEGASAAEREKVFAERLRRERERRESRGGDRGWVFWTLGYYGLLVLGAVGFAMELWPLTASSNALAVV